MSKYRVYNIVNVPNKPQFYDVACPEDGAVLIWEMAKEQLRDHSIHSNAFGLEEFNEKTNDWETWYDEDGNDVNDLTDQLYGEDCD